MLQMPFLSRSELIWPISRLKIPKISKNAFLAKSSRGHFNYCSPLLIEISQTQSDELENSNYFVLRTILNLLSPLFSREHLVAVELRYDLIIGAQSKLSYSCLKVIHANYISNIIVQVIYKTRATVFHQDIQTSRRELKIRRAAEYF